MTIPMFQVDAFAELPFQGNPAAVCLLDQTERDDAWMQNIALENNLSETAFLRRQADESFELRWFTPACEVDLCGHATLASAHVLWESGRHAADRPIQFDTRSGRLTIERDDHGIIMNFPAVAATACEPPDGLVDALGIVPIFVGSNSFDFLVEIESEAQLLQLQPDFRRLSQISARGVIVTSLATSQEYDFVSRFFAPAAGIDEDPVTGSAHCCLGPYWQSKLDRDSFSAYQASPRGGVVHLTVKGDRVLLKGTAVTIIKGELLV